ncbi:MAG: hypothetical protein ABH882_07005 [Candidatus Omnitrophota bacterium]
MKEGKGGALYNAFLKNLQWYYEKEKATLDILEAVLYKQDTNLGRLRGIMLEMVINLEDNIDEVLVSYFLFPLASEEIIACFRKEILDNLGFDRKKHILSKIKEFSALKPDITAIQDLRNNLAHKGKKRVLYKGYDIKSDKTIARQVAKDYIKIMGSLLDFIIKVNKHKALVQVIRKESKNINNG